VSWATAFQRSVFFCFYGVTSKSSRSSSRGVFKASSARLEQPVWQSDAPVAAAAEPTSARHGKVVRERLLGVAPRGLLVRACSSQASTFAAPASGWARDVSWPWRPVAPKARGRQPPQSSVCRPGRLCGSSTSRTARARRPAIGRPSWVHRLVPTRPMPRARPRSHDR